MKGLKYIPWVICIIGLIGTSFYFWSDSRTNLELLSMKNKELMTANLELGRAHTAITSQKKVHKTALADIEAKWKKEIKDRNALIVAYGELQAKLEVEKKKVKTITKIIWKERNTEKTIDIPEGNLFIKDSDGEYKEVKSVAYSYDDFRISIHGDAVKQTLSYKLHQKFKGQMIATVLPNGAKNHYIKIFELDNKGETVKELELEHLDVLSARDLPNRMMWWNPKIDLGVGAGINHELDFTWVGELGLSFSAYGVTKNDLTWRFFRAGMGITNNGFSLSFSPAQVNMGTFMPLVSNLWLYPAIGHDFYTTTTHLVLGMSLLF